MRRVFFNGPSTSPSTWRLLARCLLCFFGALTLSFFFGSLLALLTACTPRWSQAETQNESPISLAFDPAADPNHVAPITRLHLTATTSSLDLEQLYLVEGDIGPHTLNKIERGEPSASLGERAVAHLSWRNEDGNVVVAPSSALSPGEIYTIASASPLWSQSFSVLTNDPLPTLALVWPPQNMAETANVAVWCGGESLSAPSTPLRIHPDLEASLAPGSSTVGWGPDCVHLREEAPEEAITPPLLIDAKGRALARLTPRIRHSETAHTAMPTIDCSPLEQAMGPACARVLDDRATIRGPATPLLWTLQLNQQTQVIARPDGHPFTLMKLKASSATPLAFRWQTASGQDQGSVTTLLSGPARAHVVLTEVLANPFGPEPDQEWVELYNDGSVAAELEGWQLRDVGGVAELPAATLAPGAFALVVNNEYDASGRYDAAPEPGTQLLRVKRLGKNGLSNAGEKLILLDSQEQKVSAFTSTLVPKAGRSVLRNWPAAPDDDPASYALSESQPTPGALP